MVSKPDPMKMIYPTILFLVLSLLVGCADKKAEEEKARQEAEAKARADAARKEMRAMPETFKPRYNKKLEPADAKAGTQTVTPEPQNKP